MYIKEGNLACIPMQPLPLIQPPKNREIILRLNFKITKYRQESNQDYIQQNNRKMKYLIKRSTTFRGNMLKVVRIRS